MLDFDIYSDKDRAAAVRQELAALKRPPTQSQLETMANYILFAKDENGQNAVDRKEVQIQTNANVGTDPIRLFKIAAGLVTNTTPTRKKIPNLQKP